MESSPCEGHDSGLTQTSGATQERVCGDNQSEQARRYELLVTENLDGQDRKYSLTNQKPSTSTRRLSWMQRQRYWVERCFEDGKGQCGMADYQVRLWNGWHHHMALVDAGDALHADRKTPDERPMPFAKLRGYREAASGFPTAERRYRRASL
jgi:SRSO17 transposase